ncbi:hypothetical protein CFD26_103566 [Aspergillus turcosus]|uniref:C2H2-type domain-containing protein n=1 Tax=Aspergillus turcosus TaxID=1245748 RepID=A0A3R7F3S3_9EURO|nr:hypothetical protein CFD26_103566 [Aspergillus turcosus]
MATSHLNHEEDFLLQFDEALNAASVWQLKQIIRDICRQLPAATSIVSDALLVTEDEVAEERDDDDLDSELESNSEPDSELDSDDAVSETETSEQEGGREPANGILQVVAPKVPAPASRKRYRPRYAQCINCKDQYDVTDNHGEACYYHPGFPEPDEDAWADHDEWMNEDVNTKYWREEYPDKFYYPCCDRRYGDEECEIGWHEEDTTGRKKPKY